MEDFLDKIGKILQDIFVAYSTAQVVLGVILVLLGLMFLIGSRRVIKVLYFFGGLFVFALISLGIGCAIIFNTKIKEAAEKDFNDESVNQLKTSFFILLGCSGGVGLLVGILAACFGKFGIVLVGIACGAMIGLSIGIAVHNLIAMAVLTIALAIIVAILCGFFKRVFEVLTSAIFGGFLFSSGYRLIFTGAVLLTNGIEGWVNYSTRIDISSLALYIIPTVGFGIYHLSTYERKGDNMSNHDILLKKSPAYNPI